MARVRAVLASMTWKSGRRRKRAAARAVGRKRDNRSAASALQPLIVADFVRFV